MPEGSAGDGAVLAQWDQFHAEAVATLRKADAFIVQIHTPDGEWEFVACSCSGDDRDILIGLALVVRNAHTIAPDALRFALGDLPPDPDGPTP